MRIYPFIATVLLLPCLHGQNMHFAQLPLSFEVNRGQTDASVQYLAREGGQTLFLTANQAVLSLKAPVDPAPGRFQSPRTLQSRSLHGATIRMSFRNSRSADSIEAMEPLPGKVNYLIGKDPSQWHTDIPTFGRIAYHGVYPGIDLAYYGSDGRLEYDFLAQPGADTNAIQVQFEGADRIRVSADGDLILDSAAGEVRWKRPRVYQDDHGVRRSIAANYRLGKHNAVGFELARYNRKLPVVIDPVLVYSTFLGGSNTELSSNAFVDPTGIYATGTTYSLNFPTTTGAWDRVLNGTYDIYATKLNPQGTALLYSTVIGGSALDSANASLLASDGSLYLSGFTTSFDYPITAQGYLRSFPFSNSCGVITHLSPTFNSLVFSTYLGGASFDDIFGMALDPAGNIYVTGETESRNYPVTANALESTYSGRNNESFVTKLNPTASSLIYSTYLGGSGGDEEADNPSLGPNPPQIIFAYGSAIAVDSAGAAYVVGVTTSCNFPTTVGAYQRTNHCDSGDGFAVKLNTAGTAFVYSTLLGGSGFDVIQSVRVDNTGSVLLAGVTGSSDFPTTAGAYSRTYAGGAEDGFAARLDPTGSTLTYSTYFGGNDQEAYIVGDLASNGNVVLSGLTYSSNLPTTPGTFQPTYAGAGDSFITVLDPTLSSLIDSTYLGTPALDFAEASFATSPADLLVNGHTGSSTLPTTSGAYQRTYGGGASDSFIARFSLSTAAPALSITKSHSGNFNTGQVGTYTVTVSNAANAGPASGTVTVTENVPSGMTLVSMAGSGWNCSVNTCTRSDTLTGGASYGAITVTVVVASNASSPQVNSVTVSGGGSATASTTDSTIISAVPVLSVSKSHSGNFTVGQQSATYSVVVSNSGPASTSGTVTVTESLPSGLSLVSMTGSGWNCGGTTCTTSNPLGAGSSYLPITVTVNVSGSATSPQLNNVAVSGGGSAAAAATDLTIIFNPACTIQLGASSISLPPTGTSQMETCPNSSGQPNCGVAPETQRTFLVTPSAACGVWTATSSNPEFLQVTSGAAGSGQGVVGFVLLNNTHNGQQNYTITVANGGSSANFAVTEAGSGDNEVYRQVYALYEQLLGRDPDAAGFAFWTGSGGASLGQMADSFLTSPEAFNSDFAVMAAYQAATGHAPTFAQYTAAVSALRAGTAPVGNLLASLAPPGFSVTTLYANLLGRAPTTSEINTANNIGGVAAFEAIIGYQATTTPVGAPNNEFQSTGTFHTDHTNALYMYLLYYTILSRDPDPAGFNFWLGVANTGGPGILFQGNAGYPTRLQIQGPGTPNQGFIGSTEFQSLFAN